ncbi:dihydroorotate dehydrogenase electron transfer subunit [Carboxydochorda subterranea]|uniref:Dihydroorotate dehydrogenase electron transfer subunit n=1 Tax=Carboxydichorda subterranea TaxID=3109565 RepID=A0ABZ1BZZ6_9FIRM|nr:dihydroorotate dehydrogenase electron transfer subunit [Limnochorda sp. L945t]WRP18387.1 dihydroorotate dehydrogenase electron transfer subunit [Limnochorda sp. L945t]
MTGNASGLRTARVVARRELAPGVVRLDLSLPGLEEARPGQFLHVLTRDPYGVDPLLRRPFSIADLGPQPDRAALVVKVVGKGSAWLAARPEQSQLDVLGPLGRGFGWDLSGGRALLVGGGVGAAPLLWLARALCRDGWSVQAVLGFRTASEVVLAQEMAHVGALVTVATEDGSRGEPGTAVEVARRYWDRADGVFACGPWGMLRALAALATQRPRPLQLSVETVMGCGAGVCLSCVVPWRRREGYRVTGWARACVEGPVFDASELDWERCPGR